MKTNIMKKIAILITLIFIMACDFDYTVKTIIHADGSCERIVTIKDSEDFGYEIFKMDHPVPIDTTWHLEVVVDTTDGGDTVYIHTVRKEFASIEELNKLYKNDSSDYGILDRSIKYEKKFRWFYTFLNYTETYKKLFNQASINYYLDSTEIDYYYMNFEEQVEFLKENFDSVEGRRFGKAVGDKVDIYLQVTVLNSCLDAIKEASPNVSAWDMEDDDFENKRNDVVTQIETPYISPSGLLFKSFDLYEILDLEFNIDSIMLEEFKKYEPYIDFQTRYRFIEDHLDGSSYENIIEMPGLIIDSNSKNIIDNSVSWDVQWEKYFTDDYVMYVQSRIINKWAFWVSGGFILLMIFAFILRKVIKS